MRTIIFSVIAALVTVACDAPDAPEATFVSLQLGDRAPVEFSLPADEPAARNPSDLELACAAPAEPLTITAVPADADPIRTTTCATPDGFDALVDDLATLESREGDVTPRFHEQAWCDACAGGSDYYCCLCGGGGWSCLWHLPSK
jgi:hypothetical protein